MTWIKRPINWLTFQQAAKSLAPKFDKDKAEREDRELLLALNGQENSLTRRYKKHPAIVYPADYVRPAAPEVRIPNKRGVAYHELLEHGCTAPKDPRAGSSTENVEVAQNVGPDATTNLYVPSPFHPHIKPKGPIACP